MILQCHFSRQCIIICLLILLVKIVICAQHFLLMLLNAAIFTVLVAIITAIVYQFTLTATELFNFQFLLFCWSAVAACVTWQMLSQRKGSPCPWPGGLTYAQGSHAKREKIFLVFKKIYSKYKMNKHVESLPKVDKSVTSHYCTVICDVLRPIDVIFLKRQHKLFMIFCVSNFLKVGKFATFS